MKISDLLQESQNAQIQEGPLTRAVGQVGGKIAKGAAAIGKDLKTGFQAGYSGQKPAAEPEAAAAEPAAGDQAPAAKPGLIGKIKQAASDFKQGFQQGSGKPAAPEQEKAAAPAAPAAEPAAKAEPTAPAAEPAKGGEDVAKLQQQLKSLTNDVQLIAQNANNDRRDFLTDIQNLKKQVAALTKPSQSEIDADRARLGVGGSESVIRKGSAIKESIRLFRR